MLTKQQNHRVERTPSNYSERISTPIWLPATVGILLTLVMSASVLVYLLLDGYPVGAALFFVFFVLFGGILTTLIRCQRISKCIVCGCSLSYYQDQLTENDQIVFRSSEYPNLKKLEVSKHATWLASIAECRSCRQFSYCTIVRPKGWPVLWPHKRPKRKVIKGDAANTVRHGF